ncbi:hypothetical protein [Streptomyces chartreusis]
MPTPNRARASTPQPTTLRYRDRDVPADVPWPRLVFTGLLADAARHVGSLLVGLGVAWWHHD